MRHWLVAAFVMMLAALLAHHWDHAVSDAARLYPQTEGKTELLGFVDLFKGAGKGDVIVFLALIIGLGGFRRRAVAIIVSLAVVSLLVWPLKVTVKRERPRGNSYVSFPSGDAAAATAFALPLVAEVPAAIPLAGAVVVLVGAGRVLTLAHYPSDVLAGIGFGMIAGVVGLLFSRYCGFVPRIRHFLLAVTIFMAGYGILLLMGRPPTDLSRFMLPLGLSLLAFVMARCVYMHRQQHSGPAVTDKQSP